ncbi:MAG: hypothetical protein GY937_00940 [bacterium]|nr:hypothetical protein [bacterium]MCP5055270.1 hypothetical protein [bacterium]
MPVLPFAPFDAFWILLSAVLVTSARILRLLRHGHWEVWVELGRPTLLPRGGVGASAGLTRFYWSRRVRGLGDSDLRRWVITLRVLQLLLAAVLIVLWSRLLSTGTLQNLV